MLASRAHLRLRRAVWLPVEAQAILTAMGWLEGEEEVEEPDRDPMDSSRVLTERARGTIDVMCGVCGDLLYAQLDPDAYECGPSSQRHVTQELFVRSPPLSFSTPYADSTRLTCRRECHREKSMWLVDAGSGVVRVRDGYTHAIACGEGLAEVRPSVHPLYYDARRQGLQPRLLWGIQTATGGPVL